MNIGFIKTTSGVALSTDAKKALKEMRLKVFKAKNYVLSNIDNAILKTISQRKVLKIYGFP